MLANKFNDEQALVESYQKLEKEFTKKCQEVSRLKQELETKESVAEEVNVEKPMAEDSEFIEVILPEGVTEEVIDAPKLEEVVEAKEVEEKAQTTQNEYFDLDFRSKAGEFMRKSPEAKLYAKEISKILLQDKSLLNCSDPFGVAFALALKNKRNVEGHVAPIEGNVEAESEVKEFPKVSVLSSSVVGLAPREKKRKFVSISDAGEEVLKRFF